MDEATAPREAGSWKREVGGCGVEGDECREELRILAGFCPAARSRARGRVLVCLKTRLGEGCSCFPSGEPIATGHGNEATRQSPWCAYSRNGGNEESARPGPRRCRRGVGCHKARPVRPKRRVGPRSSADGRCRSACRGSTAATPGSTTLAGKGARAQSTAPCESHAAERAGENAVRTRRPALGRSATCRSYGPCSETPRAWHPC